MKSLVILPASLLCIWACQPLTNPLADSAPLIWQQPLKPDSLPCIGFGPYAWEKHLWVQVDSNAIGLRHGETGQLFWSYTLPSGWLNDSWVLEEIAVTQDALWLFHEKEAIRIDPYTGQGEVLPYGLSHGTWTTRLGYVFQQYVYLPTYSVDHVWLLRWNTQDAPLPQWDTLYSYLLGAQEYALIDGTSAWVNGWAANIRLWDAPTQTGRSSLLLQTADSLQVKPYAEDDGTGLPLIQWNGLLFAAGRHNLYAFQLNGDSLLWKLPLPFAWAVPGWALLPEGLYMLNHIGEGAWIDPLSGQILQQFQLTGISWIDRLRPGPLGLYLSWDRGLVQVSHGGWRKSHSMPTALEPYVAVLPNGIACRDRRFLYRLGP